MLKTNRLGEGSNKIDDSDFGSSEGTNINFNFPSAIHELKSPGESNFTHTNLRNSGANTSKNFQYIGSKRDSMQGEGRNNTNFFLKNNFANQSLNQSTSTKKKEKKQSFVGTQKISLNHYKLDVSKSPYKRSFNCSIADDSQVQSQNSTPGKLVK